MTFKAEREMQAVEKERDRSTIRRLERDIMEKEHELNQYRRQEHSLNDQSSQAQLRMKKENESLMETLHHEQDKSYKLLKDLHAHMQEGKALK